MEILLGKIAVVTGGSRGIGAAASIALARAGCDLAINFRSRSQEAAKVAAEIRALGRRAVVIQADVSDSEAVKQMVTEIAENLGPVSVLVNNAGIARPQKIEDIAESDWDEL